MNIQKAKAALRERLITQAEHDLIMEVIGNIRGWRAERLSTILRMALYDAVETAPGVWRPYTLAEIGERFGLTKERVRQIVNSVTSYPDILAMRAERQALYKESLAAARRNTWIVYKSGPHKGRTRPEYLAYGAMLQRCFNPNHFAFPRYGARGVTVCNEWLGKHGYKQFFKDMGPRPRRKHSSGRSVYSIHRIDNVPLYAKATCMWATTKEQTRPGQRRRRQSVKV